MEAVCNGIDGGCVQWYLNAPKEGEDMESALISEHTHKGKPALGLNPIACRNVFLMQHLAGLYIHSHGIGRCGQGLRTQTDRDRTFLAPG